MHRFTVGLAAWMLLSSAGSGQATGPPPARSHHSVAVSNFGLAVSKSGDLLAVGNEAAGVVTVYERAAPGGSWTTERKLLAHQDDRRFGVHLACTDEWILVSSNTRSGGLVDGFVTAFEMSDPARREELDFPGGFIRGLAVEERTLAVSVLEHGGGQVYVFLHGEDGWQLASKLSCKPGMKPISYGRVLDVRSSRLFISYDSEEPVREVGVEVLGGDLKRPELVCKVACAGENVRGLAVGGRRLAILAYQGRGAGNLSALSVFEEEELPSKYRRIGQILDVCLRGNGHLAIGGDLLVVGCGTRGTVEVHDLRDEAMGVLSTLECPVASQVTGFGYALVMDEEGLLVGAPWCNDNGAAFYYGRQGNGLGTAQHLTP